MTTKKRVRLTKAQKQEQAQLKQIKECEESLAAQKLHALEMIALAEKMPGDNPMQRAFRWQWLRVKKDLTKY